MVNDVLITVVVVVVVDLGIFRRYLSFLFQTEAAVFPRFSAWTKSA